MSDWSSVRRGEAVVTFGQPYYGKRRIIANAPLSVINFNDLIEALTEAREVYLQSWESTDA